MSEGEPSRRLLIVRLSALGDIIHTIPAVAALRAALPPADRIGWVVEAPYRELVEIVAPVDDVFTVATKRWRRAPFSGSTRADVARSWRELRGFGRGAASVDFQGLIKSAILPWVAGSSPRYGFASGVIREKPAAWFLERTVDLDPSQHVIEWNLALARAVAPKLARPEVDFRVFAADPDEKLGSFAGSVVLLPGAGKPNKQWPVERFRELARELRQRQGVTCVAAWGPGERQLAEAVADGGVAQLAPPTSLRELAYLLANARLVVGGDTGPLHLADALAVPVVGLFGPTNPRRNGPYAQLHSVVESFSSARTMEAVEVADVLHLAEQRLGQAERGAAR
jgi:lipopolysaccharide heptosyltransferase I